MSGPVTYTWEILKLEYQSQNEGTILNEILIVTWKKTGVDGNGDMASYIGQSFFTADTVPVGEWVPYANLTEALVLSWVVAATAANASIDYYIEQEINREENPIIDPGPLPWTV